MREEVRKFAEIMEAKLAKHDGDWGTGWKQTDPFQLMHKLNDEASELWCALSVLEADGGPPTSVANECADVANMAMMIADANGGLPDPARPTIVCLCGSTRFWKHFQEASLRETLAGKIVLSVGAAVASDEEHFGHLPQEEKDEIKRKLDDLHLRKIDLADEVLVLNVDNYIGESTGREIQYALNRGKDVRFLEERD